MKEHTMNNKNIFRTWIASSGIGTIYHAEGGSNLENQTLKRHYNMYGLKLGPRKPGTNYI